MDAFGALRVTLAHDWLTGMRGGEKVLDTLCRHWPGAPLYTLIHRAGSVSDTIENRAIHTSFLQKLPAVHRYYRYLLPVMPYAVGWRLSESDVVISSSHCVIKGIVVPAGVPHICYCHTPMRYAWHMQESYFGTRGRLNLKRVLINSVLKRLREWDRHTARGVTHFIANSRVVQRRILDCYGRSSEVIYPPVDTEFYKPATTKRGDHYLVVSALAPYKRVDLAIEACAKLKRKLIVIGTGQQEGKLKRLAGPNVEFLGWQSDESVRLHLRNCRALLFPGEEDFGIVPVEAQACSTPVIAFGRGGATETVVPLDGAQEPTGAWFEEQSVASLNVAMQTFETQIRHFDPGAIRRHAEKFNTPRFARDMAAFVENVVKRQSTARAA